MARFKKFVYGLGAAAGLVTAGAGYVGYLKSVRDSYVKEIGILERRIKELRELERINISEAEENKYFEKFEGLRAYQLGWYKSEDYSARHKSFPKLRN